MIEFVTLGRTELELAHLLQPTHNARFFALMDTHMPRWQFYRELLNRLPVRRESWDY